MLDSAKKSEIFLYVHSTNSITSQMYRDRDLTSKIVAKTTGLYILGDLAFVVP